MYQDEPGLECASLSMKYTPWKDALLVAWKKVKNKFPAPHKRSMNHRAQLVCQVFLHAAGIIACKPVAPTWALNCNRGRGRDQGPVIFLRNMKVIQKNKPADDKCQKVRFTAPTQDDSGATASRKETRTSKKTNAKKKQNPWWYIIRKPKLASIKLYIQAFDAIKEAVGPAPRTVAEWSEKMRAGYLGPSSPHLSAKYLKSWHIRSYMLSCMYREGIKQLEVEDFPLNAFVNMNPDVCGNLKRLRSHLEMTRKRRNVSITQYLKGCHSGKPELFSMWCCLALDRSFRESDFRRFDHEQWQRVAKTYHSVNGVFPHPAV